MNGYQKTTLYRRHLLWDWGATEGMKLDGVKYKTVALNMHTKFLIVEVIPWAAMPGAKLAV